MRRWLNGAFRRRENEPFAILRLGLGLACFLEFLTFAPRVLEDFSSLGYYPWSARGEFGPDPGPLYLLGLSDEPAWVLLCYIGLLVTAALFALGWRTRWTGPLLWLLQLSFIDRNVYVMTGAPILSTQLLLIVMWFDLGGPPGLKNSVRQPGPPAWAGWLLYLQMSICYFKSGFYKAMGKAWMDGDAVKLMLANPDWRRLNFDGWLAQSWVLRGVEAFTHLTAAWELLFPLLLLNPKTRKAALALGILIHTGQFFTVSTASFPLLLLATYPCLLGDGDYAALRSALGARLPSRFRSKRQE